MRSLVILLYSLQALFAREDGSITITVDGESQKIYLVNREGMTGSVRINNSTSYTLLGSIVTLYAKQNSETFSTDMYYNMQLLGKELSYTVDNSNVGCSCNSAFYFASMPGYKSDGEYEPSTEGTYYCDANKVGGNFCPQMDISEANKYTMASTPHTCSQPTKNNFYSSCDRAGCGSNIFWHGWKAMGPSDDHTINTMKPYRHSTAFIVGDDGHLATIRNTFKQDDRQFTFDACGEAEYLKNMTEYLESGMVPITSIWGSAWIIMSWLDYVSLCVEDCDLDNSSATYDDITLTTL